MKTTRLLASVIAVLVLCSCAGVPQGVTPVSGFEPERYMGTWYEIARIDNKFERGLSRVTAEYSLQADGTVKVVNRGYDAAADEWKEAEGRAVFMGDPDVASLKVSFFGPFFGGYHVIALDREDYEYALVCGSDRSYLWILAREKQLEPETYYDLVSRAGKLGFDTSLLKPVEQ